MTFKDSLQWVDHLNSRKHLRAVGQTDHVDRATLEEVRSRLAWLRQRRAEIDDGAFDYDIKKRLAERKRLEEDERRQRREARARKKRARRGLLDSDAPAPDADPEAAAMAAMMGFSGFGTTKVN
ncbi:uncharacterized protein V1510DRAFT_419358 [Dipodascopsis tothii]|uniref:uncharacterized protein n=1 Tax=Dipodascopsis tothii TaxID=44089 RepID=UPI0034CE7012